MKFLVLFPLLFLTSALFGQDIKSSKYHYDLSIEKVNKGDIKGAMKSLDEALTIDSTYQDAYYLKGYIYYQTNRPQLAVIEYDKLLEINPEHSDALKNRALSKLRAYDLEGAVADHTLRIAREPNNAIIYFDRAYCKGMLRDFQGAIEDYSQAIKLNSDCKEAYTNRGFTRINALTTNGVIQPSAEQTQSACEDFLKARELGDSTGEDMIYVYCSKQDKKSEKPKKKKKKKKDSK